ncbi:hypothetical protein Pcinc_005601 [Petrolisthes cinctipes]|uniref:Meckelin n=1 Tax=Petrolisthes cinctipes TaxID=88211 RepID=A0AAE1GCC5_PETCI|nr:hypothetical protein Pcinc_005601 [Petrolisthes cinctipes]
MSCIQCSNDTVPGDGDYGPMCVPCHESYYSAGLEDSGTGLCECPKTHGVVGGLCTPLSELAKIPDRQSSYEVKYEGGERVQSSFLEVNYRSAAHSCKFRHNRTACNLLANMCVLLHYEFDDDFNACRYYREEFGKNFVNLPDYVPWLYYPDGEAHVYLYKAKLKTSYSFKSDNPNSKFNFTVAKYSAEGKLLQYGRLEEVMNFCPLVDLHLDSAVRFGVTFSQSCLVGARNVWDEYETVFYEMFIQYFDEGQKMIYAVPVLNANYREDGELQNQWDQKKWQLTRRFFLFDNLSGRETLPPTANNDGAESASSVTEDDRTVNRAKVVRYAKSLEITIQLREGDGHGQIYPPLIRISYGEVPRKYYGSDRKVRLSLSVTYTMDFSKIHEDLSIAVGVTSALAVLWSLVGAWGWCRRCGKLGIDIPTIFQFLVITCGNLANVFFLVMFFACFYLMVFFKRQDVVHLLLLTLKQEFLIKQYLIAAFFLKLVQILHIIYVQITLDLFIIDWEQPRAKNSIPHPQLSTNSEEEGKLRGGEQPISIWRTYFLANEWNEIQTHRKINVSFQLLVTLLFLKVIGFENLASADPTSNFHPTSDAYVSPQSYVCRFAISITVYVVVVAVQWLVAVIFYERYIKNQLQQLIDLCSIANISIFILEHRMYGYYIHGRSAHGFADVNMQSIYEQMKREEQDLCGHRGLEPSSECQTFEVVVTHRFREQYDTILKPVHILARSQRPVGSGKTVMEEMEESFQAHEAMKRFFGMFLQHALRNLDYIVKEKLFLESILDIEFQEADDRCLFFRDNNHSFDRVLFYGHEVTFILFEMLLFTFIDIMWNNFVLAAVVTFVLVWIMKKIRYAGGRRNVINKTMVDQRFLI